MTFSSDHRFFYLDEKPFFPIIGDGADSLITPIDLPAEGHHDLIWRDAKKKALDALQKGKYLFWHFHFGLENGILGLDDTARFLSFTIAIDEFLKEFWPLFSEKTFGASLYQGSLNISSRFLWAGDHENNIRESGLDEDLYCMNVFAEYLHRLASHFPDALLPFCFFDGSSYLPVKIAQLLSKERFAHLQLAVKGPYVPLGSLTWQEEITSFSSQDSVVGLLLPPDSKCSPEILARLEDFLKQDMQPRIIPETLFNEQWDGLDQVFAIEEALTIQGRRRLQGFAAAGGEIFLI